MEYLEMNKVELKHIMHLIKKIRLTREELCNNLGSEELKKLNSYENKSDAYIIIEALKHDLWSDEEDLEIQYQNIEEKENDKTN